jgi:hypothetical protein
MQTRVGRPFCSFQANLATAVIAEAAATITMPVGCNADKEAPGADNCESNCNDAEALDERP